MISFTEQIKVSLQNCDWILYHELSVFDVVLIIRLMVGQPYAIFVFIHIFPPDIVKHSYDLSFCKDHGISREEGLKAISRLIWGLR